MQTEVNGIVTAVSASPRPLHDTAKPPLTKSHEKIMGTHRWIAAGRKVILCRNAYLQNQGIKISIKPEAKSNRPKHYSKKEFSYDKKRNQHICPRGNILDREAKTTKLTGHNTLQKWSSALRIPKEIIALIQNIGDPGQVLVTTVGALRMPRSGFIQNMAGAETKLFIL